MSKISEISCCLALADLPFLNVYISKTKNGKDKRSFLLNQHFYVVPNELRTIIRRESAKRQYNIVYTYCGAVHRKKKRFLCTAVRFTGSERVC